MSILGILLSLFAMLLAVAAYRLGVADGLSAGRSGRLIGRKMQKEEETLLKRIEAYDGRKESTHANR